MFMLKVETSTRKFHDIARFPAGSFVVKFRHNFRCWDHLWSGIISGAVLSLHLSRSLVLYYKRNKNILLHKIPPTDLIQVVLKKHIVNIDVL